MFNSAEQKEIKRFFIEHYQDAESLGYMSNDQLVYLQQYGTAMLTKMSNALNDGTYMGQGISLEDLNYDMEVLTYNVKEITKAIASQESAEVFFHLDSEMQTKLIYVGLN
jgi:hypothetical protein